MRRERTNCVVEEVSGSPTELSSHAGNAVNECLAHDDQNRVHQPSACRKA